MAQWVGYMVSIATNGKGTYQGEIFSATGSEITLNNAFCDGIPCSASQILIRYIYIST